MTSIDGRAIAKKKEKQLAAKIKEKGLSPVLASFVAKEDDEGQLYTELKKGAAERVGISFEQMDFSLGEPENALGDLSTLDFAKYHGFIIQKPTETLAKKFFDDPLDFKSWWVSATSMLPPEKDVDCLSPTALGLLFLGQPVFLPATVRALYDLLLEAVGDEAKLNGKHAVVVGSSDIIGKPMALLLRNLGATVSFCGATVKDLPALVKQGEIIVSCVGKPGLITGEMVQDNAIVLDAGYAKKDGKVMGDVDFDSVSQKASFITPVPGGVGPMTVMCLLENTVSAAEHDAG